MQKIDDRLKQVEVLFKAGKLRQAEFLLHHMHSAHPEDFEVNFLLGQIALEAGNVMRAEELFQMALKERPDSPLVHFYSGLCYGRQNRFDRAIKAFESALRLNPDYKIASAQKKIHHDLWMRFKVRYANKPIKIGILTTVWRRPGVTRVVLNHYSNINNDPDVELIKLAVGSEGKASRNLCESTGWNYLEYENRPLSKKWQAGLYALKSMNPDFIITVGSDDILTSDYFRKIASRCPLNGCTGIYDFWFLEIDSRRMGYWSEMKSSTPYGGGYIRTLGAGRCYSRNVLDDLNWQLWTKELDSGLDGMAEMRMLNDLHRKPTCYSMQNLGSFALDIKSGQNLWNFGDYKYNTILKQKKTESILTELGLSHILRIESIAQ